MSVPRRVSAPERHPGTPDDGHGSGNGDVGGNGDAPDARRVGVVVDALAAVTLPARPRDLAAEVAGVLRWAVTGADAGEGLVAVFDARAAAGRLVSLLTCLGIEDGTVRGEPTRRRWRVALGPVAGDDVARRSGIVDARGRRTSGLAPWLVGGSLPEAVAAWRGAVLVAGMIAPGRLVLPCPNTAVALGMVELGLRLGLRARVDRALYPTVVVDGPGEVALLLASCGGAATVTAAGLAPPAEAGSANRTRAAVAASRGMATVADAFEILEAAGVEVPAALAAAGRLRLCHPTLDLVELADRADEPTTKDTLAGRLRRLAALAARHRHPGAAPGSGVAPTPRSPSP